MLKTCISNKNTKYIKKYLSTKYVLLYFLILPKSTKEVQLKWSLVEVLQFFDVE